MTASAGHPAQTSYSLGSGAALADVLARAAPARDVAGNTPFILDRNDHAVFIASGSIDLFMVELDGGRAIGTRHYCSSFPAGSLLFGIEASGDLMDVGLLAVGTVGTRVVDIPLHIVRALGDRAQHRDALAGMVEVWIAALADTAARTIVPQPHVDLVLGPDEGCAGIANQRIGVAHGVVWVSLDAGAPLFLDSEDIVARPDEPIPLTPRTWIGLGGAATASGRDTQAALKDGSLWPGLRAYHRAVINVVPLLLRMAAADEANRLRMRSEGDAGAVARGSASLAAVVRSAPQPVHGVASDDALFRACAAVAVDLGVDLTEPPRGISDRPPQLDDILRANRMRKRRIMLAKNWWQSDAGSFLLIAPDGEPFAVRRADGRYTLFRPATGEIRPLPAAEAGRLDGAAFMFYQALPAEPITLRRLAALVGRWGRPELMIVGAFSLVSSLLALAMPIATGLMVDTVIPGRDIPRLFEIVVILLVVALVQLVISAAIQRAVLRLEGLVGTKLQTAVIDRLLRMPTGFFSAFTTGDLAIRALAIQRVEAFLTNSMMASLLTGAFALTSFVLMFFYSLLLGGIAIAIAALFAAVAIPLGIVRLRHEREVMQMKGRLSGELLEMTTGIAKLRLAAAEQRVFGRWAVKYAALEQRTKAAKRTLIFNELLSASIRTLGQAILFAVVIYAMLLETGLGLGTLVAFMAAFNQALAGVVQISQTMLELVALRPILQHASPILLASPEASGADRDPGVLDGAIEISHVAFRYASGTPHLFQDFSLQIAPGEFVALVGPSGCGKSTVVRLLLGFETPERGAVLFDGKDLRGLNVEAVRRQMGVVLQSSRLVGSSMLENIIGAHSEMGEAEAWRAAALAGLDDDIRAMPMGLYTMLSESTLSGGQLQRVAIARSFVADPRIVIFDEATSALDNRTQAIVTASLERMRATRIVVAHRLSTVMSADRIVVLHEGRIVESGSYDELMQADGFFARLAERQIATTRT